MNICIFSPSLHKVAYEEKYDDPEELEANARRLKLECDCRRNPHSVDTAQDWTFYQGENKFEWPKVEAKEI